MVFNFSENLIKETISCFYDEDGISLSIEQAQEYLASFADLFLAFAGKNDHPASAEAGGHSPILPSSSGRGVSNTSGTF